MKNIYTLLFILMINSLFKSQGRRNFNNFNNSDRRNSQMNFLEESEELIEAMDPSNYRNFLGTWFEIARSAGRRPNDESKVMLEITDNGDYNLSFKRTFVRNGELEQKEVIGTFTEDHTIGKLFLNIERRRPKGRFRRNFNENQGERPNRMNNQRSQGFQNGNQRGSNGRLNQGQQDPRRMNNFGNNQDYQNNLRGMNNNNDNQGNQNFRRLNNFVNNSQENNSDSRSNRANFVIYETDYTSYAIIIHPSRRSVRVSILTRNVSPLDSLIDDILEILYDDFEIDEEDLEFINQGS